MTKRLAGLCIWILFAFMLFACQENSETIIQNRNDFEDLLLVEAKDYRQNSAEKVVWTEVNTVQEGTDSEKTITVNIDADISRYPDTIPVYLIEPADFSEEDAKKVTGYFANGPVFQATASKDDMLLRKVIYEKNLYEHKIALPGDQSFYDDLQKAYDNAAQENIETDYTFVNIKEALYELYLYNAKAYPYDDSIMWFEIANGGQMETKIDMWVTDFETRYLDEQPIDENTHAKGISMNYQEAFLLADKAIKTLVDSDMELAVSTLMVKRNEYDYLWSDEWIPIEEQAYVFRFTRSYDGIPSLYIDEAPKIITDSSQAFREPYRREGAYVVVEDCGITQFSYWSPSEVIEVVNPNVEVLSFDEVLQKFKDNVFYSYFWSNTSANININITKVEFGMVREPVKGTTDQYLMVPAWNFYGDIQAGITNMDLSIDSKSKSILALSAVDGSIITDFEPMTNPL